MKNCVFSSPGMIAEDSGDNSTITTNKRLNTEGTQQITTFPTKSTDSLKKLFQHRCCHGNFTTWNETIMQSPCSLRKTQPAGKHLIRTAEPTLLLLFCFKFGGEKKGLSSTQTLHVCGKSWHTSLTAIVSLQL